MALSATMAMKDKVVAAQAVQKVKEIREVWKWNLDVEFQLLLGAVISAGGPHAVLALDVEFPGFFYPSYKASSKDVKYEALRCNVDATWPIQLGIAVANSHGVVRGVWCFNLHFDIDVHLHTKESTSFLRRAGLNFERHKSEGISAESISRWLRGTHLLGRTPHLPLPLPLWVTFSGQYDLGYMMKLLMRGMPLPIGVAHFDGLVDAHMPWRFDLQQEYLRWGSLENWGKEFGVQRHGAAHTAGSDALLTLELYPSVLAAKTREENLRYATSGSWPAHGSWISRDSEDSSGDSEVQTARAQSLLAR